MAVSKKKKKDIFGTWNKNNAWRRQHAIKLLFRKTSRILNFKSFVDVVKIPFYLKFQKVREILLDCFLHNQGLKVISQVYSRQ